MPIAASKARCAIFFRAPFRFLDGPRKPRPTKLDEHKDYLRDRLEQAGAIRLSATVLLRQIRMRGYDGGVTQLKEYLGSIRP
jgi:transposase